MEHIVIAGAGHAGVQLADSLRAEGCTAPVTLISAEPGLPYQRPPLSKDFLVAGSAPQPLPLKAGRFFTDTATTLIEDNRITGLDRAARTITLADGQTFEYSHLVFATGARNRTLTVPGAELGGVHYLRTITDAAALHAALDTAQSVVVVGAGFIGLEFAAAARARGLAVTVLEYGRRPMARAVSEETARYFTDTHTAAGIRLVFGQTVTALEPDGARVAAALGGDGTRYPADLVVIGIGVHPNTELAAAAGLPTTHGIEVDTYLRTPDDHVWAIGDCAHFPCRHAGTSTRRESVQNAVDQARALARTLTATPTEYAELPWFWSHQGTEKLQIAGVATRPDRTVLHGDPASGKFSVFRFQDSALACVESVNQPRVHMTARKVLATNARPTPEQVLSPGFDLKNFLTRPAVV
ncbi:NAD(P)/FAD-dependent oxidoreductase [Rhodococcus sp. NPDC019627]|uniref:NAD(P)/FAD-dependent oxidoreductase n=1 Tax=unclassified Rhodococcus (in: high G+C Gram-positive bacteria) TaxID=192944 RepID=UPI00340AF3F0